MAKRSDNLMDRATAYNLMVNMRDRLEAVLDLAEANLI